MTGRRACLTQIARKIQKIVKAYLAANDAGSVIVFFAQRTPGERIASGGGSPGDIGRIQTASESVPGAESVFALMTK